MSTEMIGFANPEWEFCDRLRKVRRSIADMTQAEMAEAMGVSQKVYAAWESGKNKPADIVSVAKLVAELWPGRVTSSWLLGVEDGPPPPPPRPFVEPQDGGAQIIRHRAFTRRGPAGRTLTTVQDEIDDSYIAMAEDRWLPRLDSNQQPFDQRLENRKALVAA